MTFSKDDVEFNSREYMSLRFDTLETLIDERDKQYAIRFKASSDAVNKAEMAQRGVNERQNEFRGQLSDQAATFMPRKESEANWLSVRDMIDREFRLVRADIASLRETRSENAGASVRGSSDQSRQQWVTGIIFSAVGLAFGIVTFLLLNVVVK